MNFGRGPDPGGHTLCTGLTDELRTCMSIRRRHYGVSTAAGSARHLSGGARIHRRHEALSAYETDSGCRLKA